MTIKLDKYIECVEGKTNRDHIINLLNNSQNFRYNKELDQIELRIKTVGKVIHINKKDETTFQKIKIKLDSLKIKFSLSEKEKFIEILIEDIGSINELLSLLKNEEFDCVLDTCSIKERIYQTKDIFNSKENFLPRKFSDNIESHFKNKFDNPNYKEEYKGKKSFNKFDDPRIYMTQSTKPGYYSFKDISMIYFNLKNTFSFPKDWKEIGLEDLIRVDCRKNLDHFIDEKKEFNRERAFTECNIKSIIFKLEQPYRHKKSYNEEYWNVKSNK